MKLNTKDFEARMSKAIVSLDSNLDTVRAGQASAAVLNRVTFEYYGSQTPIKDMADIRLADSRTLEIKPYDGSTLKAMEKAILASDVGITPANDAIKKAQKDSEMTEDEAKASEKSVQDLTDKFIKQIDTAVSKKQSDVMAI